MYGQINTHGNMDVGGYINSPAMRVSTSGKKTLSYSKIFNDMRSYLTVYSVFFVKRTNLSFSVSHKVTLQNKQIKY